MVGTDENPAPNTAEALETWRSREHRHSSCTAPGCLDNRLRYAACLKLSSCQVARIWAGLRYPFFSISHSAL